MMSLALALSFTMPAFARADGEPSDREYKQMAQRLARTYAPYAKSDVEWSIQSFEKTKTTVSVNVHYVKESYEGNADCPFTVTFKEDSVNIKRWPCAD